MPAVKLEGALTWDRLEPLRDQILTNLEEGKITVLDFNALESGDSGVLQFLVALGKKGLEHPGKLIFTGNLTKGFQALLIDSGFARKPLERGEDLGVLWEV